MHIVCMPWRLHVLYAACIAIARSVAMRPKLPAQGMHKSMARLLPDEVAMLFPEDFPPRLSVLARDATAAAIPTCA